MKIFTKITLAFLLLLSSPSIASAENGSGGSVDNGGEYLALKFTKLGQEALSAMKKLKPAEAILSAAELQRMEIAITKTRVNGLPGPLLDNSGREVDARYLLTEGKPVIELDEVRWPRIFSDLDTSYRLVAHEYFRAMGLNDDNYKISARLSQGTAKEILHGRLVVNPGSIGGQSKFEQLGDYFSSGEIPSPIDFSKGKIFCYNKEGDAFTNLRAIWRTIPAGPLLEPAYWMEIDYFQNGAYYEITYLNTDQLLTKDQSLYTNARPIFEHYFKGTEWYFRRKGEYLLLETRAPAEEEKGATVEERCYFWRA